MKKNKQIVPLCFIVAIAIFCIILFSIVKDPIEDHSIAKESAKQAQSKLDKQKENYSKIENNVKSEEMKLKSIKQLYESNTDTASNMSAFGTMFDDIIRQAQINGLLIRSIAYEMNPMFDTIYASASDSYNVCELKLYLVGSYSQLKSFLNEMINNYQYLISISKLSVSAYSGDTDYILANLSINLYSKKPIKK